MKKFISALLALTMIFSLCGISALAAEPGSATMTAVVNTAPTTNGAVSDAANIKVGDIFEVTVKATNVANANVVRSAQVIVGWDPAIVEVVDAKGATAAKASTGYIKGAGFPDKDEYDSDLFNWSQVTLDAAAGVYDMTAFIMNAESDFFGVGYPIEGTELEFAKIRFKAKAAGNTGIKVLEKKENGIPTGMYLGDETTKAALTFASVDIVVKGSEPGPTVTTKKITKVDASSVATTATVGDTVTLPATLPATVEGETAPVNVAVTWTPATVDTSKAGTVTVTGKAAAPAATETVKYEFAEGADTVKVDIVVSDKPVEVVTKTITKVDASAVKTEATVGDTVELPATLPATVEGETDTVDVAVTWTPATVDTTEAGDVTVTAKAAAPAATATVKYEFAEGADTVSVTITVKEAAGPGPEPEIKNITSIDNPEPMTVYVDSDPDQFLPETVVGHVENSDETVAVPVVWSPLYTNKKGTKNITGTLYAPEGYTLKKGLKATLKVTIVNKPAAPTVESIGEVNVVKTAYVGDDVVLPATVKAVVDGVATDLALTWTPDAVDTTTAGEKKLTAKVAIPEGSILAAGVSDTIEITVIVSELPELPVNTEAEVSTDGTIINFTFSVDSNKLDNVSGGVKLGDKTMVYVCATFMNGKVPMGTWSYGMEYGTMAEGRTATLAVDKLPAGATSIYYSAIVGFDPSKPMSQENLGIPVGPGRTMELAH